MLIEELVEKFPIKSPYLYFDDIISITNDEIIGSYTFKHDEFFYEGHFPGNPITPGAILQESAAQIGLLAFGMYLLDKSAQLRHDTKFLLGSADLRYTGIVRPGEKVIITATLVRFRFNTIKSQISITKKDEVICKGVLTGFVLNEESNANE